MSPLNITQPLGIWSIMATFSGDVQYSQNGTFTNPCSMRSQNHKIRCGEDMPAMFWTVQRRAFKAFVAPFFTWDQWHGPGQQNDLGLIRALLGSNTSICLRHSLDTVNSGSFWHSSKTQAGDLCVIAWIILNPKTDPKTLNPKPETLKTIENQETTLNLNSKAQNC